MHFNFRMFSINPFFSDTKPQNCDYWIRGHTWTGGVAGPDRTTGVGVVGPDRLSEGEC